MHGASRKRRVSNMRKGSSARHGTSGKSGLNHFEQLEARQLMSGGQLDLTLGQLGVAKPNLGFTPTDVAVMRDGRIVVIGDGSAGWMIARLNPNGTPDTTFGDGDGLQSAYMGKYNDAFKVAIDRDGK